MTSDRALKAPNESRPTFTLFTPEVSTLRKVVLRGRRAAALEDVVRRGLASARPGGVRRRGGRLLAQGLAVEGAQHPQLPLRHAAMLARVRSCSG